METANLRVEGMSCGHCVHTIEKSLGAINGVGRVGVDLKGKRVSVEYDPQAVDAGTIRLAIEDQGYRTW